MLGFFITFEGIEGSGKSTQIKLLDEYLRGLGFATLLTREPGGTRLGDEIRSMLLSPDNKEMAPLTELLLYEASRAQHCEQVIRPALAKGEVVLSDRFADSSVAYQGAARMIDAATVEAANHIATSGLAPDVTFVLDMSAADGLARAKGRGAPDRLEQEKLEFHERVRQGFLDIAKKEFGRVCVIDASRNAEEIHKEIVQALSRRGLLSK